MSKNVRSTVVFGLFVVVLLVIVFLFSPGAKHGSGEFDVRNYRNVRQKYINRIATPYTHWYWRSYQYRHWANIVQNKYCKHRIPEGLLWGDCRQESLCYEFFLNTHSGATGMWQFMPGSGVKYGMYNVGAIMSTDRYKNALNVSRKCFNKHSSHEKIMACLDKPAHVRVYERLNNYNYQHYGRTSFKQLVACRRKNTTYEGVMKCLHAIDDRYKSFLATESAIKHFCNNYDEIRQTLKKDPIGHGWIMALQAYYQGPKTVRPGTSMRRKVLAMTNQDIYNYIHQKRFIRNVKDFFRSSFSKGAYKWRILRYMYIVRRWDANTSKELQKLNYKPKKLPARKVGNGLAMIDAFIRKNSGILSGKTSKSKRRVFKGMRMLFRRKW